MNSTPESPFFRAPIEVRHQIYRMLLGTETHLFLHEGKLHAMPCQGTDDVSLRRPQSDTGFKDPRWMRRVNSNWGCHWKCEEAYLDGVQEPEQGYHMPLLSLVLTSKTMFFDVQDFLSQATQCIHMTDLETIDHVLPTSVSDATSSSSANQRSEGTKQWPLFKSMKNISLTLRLTLRMLSTLYLPRYSKPLKPYYPRLEVEPVPPPRPDATPEGSGCKREHEQWMRIWPSLLELSCLQRFTLWLDHHTYHVWWLVGERDVLEHLSEIMPALKSRNTQVVVNLPEIVNNEGRGDADHFIEELPEFELLRRTRLPLATWSWMNMSDEVQWIVNEDNTNERKPSDFPEGEGFEDTEAICQMGYDPGSPEFEMHPLLSVFIIENPFMSQY